MLRKALYLYLHCARPGLFVFFQSGLLPGAATTLAGCNSACPLLHGGATVVGHRAVGALYNRAPCRAGDIRILARGNALFGTTAWVWRRHRRHAARSAGIVI
jgi:hypothetical protein